ncbi:MAG: PfkB family carbohydrate kinase [Pseudonocardiaceae bacterium]
MNRPQAKPRALFVGLCTVDVIQLVNHVPIANEKITALRQTIAAGGPAANAAATCSHLGGNATLLTGIGSHPLTADIHSDLGDLGVRIVDLDENWTGPPTVSSIMVTAGTGERAVVSTNAVGRILVAPDYLAALVEDADVVQLDGHHIDLARAAAKHATRAGRITVLDGGSWKAGTTELLPLLDVAVCSADFHPPGTSTPQETLEFLGRSGVRFAAVTRGPNPIQWQGPKSSGEIDTLSGEIADTLGAGDVFHGALTYVLASDRKLTTDSFIEALSLAAGVATTSCTSFGTRTWMLTGEDPAMHA